MKNGDFQEMQMIYFERALFIHNEGKACFDVLKEARKCELRAIHRFNVEKVEIVTARDKSCSECQKLHGTILTISEATETMLIPVKNCSHKINQEAPTGWCRCLYIPRVF
jgi:hypothetical protein